MKRSICILLLVTLLFSLAACGTKETPPQGENTERPATGAATGTAPSAGGTAGAPTGTNGTDAPDAPDVPDNGRFSLFYDDRYTFSETIAQIETLTVTSRVCGGEDGDAAVLTGAGDGKTVIATGVGEATVKFSDGTEKNVTVKPAKISMLFVLGQSNAEGMIFGATKPDGDRARSQSILCEEGQVYSTYAPAQNVPHTYGDNIGGVSFGEKELHISNAASFVASSLTGNTNAAGEALVYPLNQLTAAGAGKSGLDSGLGFAWNTLYDEKVWVINAAHSGSLISSWQPGESETDNNFWQAVGVAQAALDTMEREVRAGHYTVSRMGYFWLQGCGDKLMSSADYLEQYVTMHRGLTEQITRDFDGDGTAETLSFGGILMVRNPLTQLTVLDLKLNGPRTAQFLLGSTAVAGAENVYLVSTLGDRFTDDLSVENYFRSTYPSGKTVYTTRTEYPLPRTAAEVHPDIHYRQPGYNELAMDAVRNLRAAMVGETTDAGASLLKPDGKNAYRDGETLTLAKGEGRFLAILTDPVVCTEKNYTIKVTGSGISYRAGMLTAAADATDEGTLTLSRGDTVILTLKIRISG